MKNLKYFIRIQKIREIAKKPILDELKLKQILKEIANEKKIFNSTKEIREEIQKRIGKKYKLPSTKRLLKTILKVGAKIKVRKKKIKKEFEKCPVCQNYLRAKIEKNLKGEKTVLYYFCPFCNFKTKDKKEVPIRYTIYFP